MNESFLLRLSTSFFRTVSPGLRGVLQVLGSLRVEAMRTSSSSLSHRVIRRGEIALIHSSVMHYLLRYNSSSRKNVSALL